MPFEKGRIKTGGRTKGESLRRSPRFIDQLQRYGLNTAKELAHGLMALPPASRFDAIRQLLPYLIPKLKEIDPPVLNQPDSQTPISTDDLLEALNGGKEKPHKRSKDHLPAVEEGRINMEAPSGTENNLSDLDQQQENH